LSTTDRVSRGLRWTGSGLLVFGCLLTVAAIGWTQSAEALVTASAIAAFAFGIPGIAAFALAYWLESAGGASLAQGAARLVKGVRSTLPPAALNDFVGPWRGYAIALLAVLLSWAAREALDSFFPRQLPFITFYLAVAVAAWLGGFGPAVFATLFSLALSWFFFFPPSMSFRLDGLGGAIPLGLFTLVCLGIAAITASLRVALAEARRTAAGATQQAAMLREAESKLHVMANTAPALIWMSDTTKACVYFNETWLRFTGRTLAQELGNGWAEGLHPKDLARCLAVYESAFEQRVPFTMEYRLRSADGSYRTVLDKGIPRYDESGAFAGYIGACMDVTDVATAPAQNDPGKR
jgi:PAS domain S-box-containing protein